MAKRQSTEQLTLSALSLSPELIEAAKTAQRIQEMIPPELIKNAALASKAVAPVAKMSLSEETEAVERTSDIKKGGETREPPNDKDKMDNNTGALAYADGSVSRGTKEKIPKKGKRSIPYVTEDPKVLKEYFGVVEPHNIDDCITCIQRLSEVIQVKEQLLRNKRPDYTIHYRDLDINFDDTEELDALIKLLDDHIQAFQSKLPNYDVELVGKNLDYLCARHNTNREMLEKVLDMGSHYFDRVLNPADPKRRMSVEVMNNVCQLFGVTSDSFLNDDLSKTMMTGIRKAFRFVDGLKDKTMRRQMHWDETPALMKTGMHMAERLTAKGLSSKDPVESTDYWEAKTPAGSCYLVYTVSESGRKNYKIGLSATERIQWLFETSSDKKGELFEHCKRLHELINEQRDEFYLTNDASMAMDDFMEAFNNFAVEKGRNEYYEKKLQDYRERLEEEAADRITEEVDKRYSYEVERLEANGAQFNETILKRRIMGKVQEEVEKDIERMVEDERRKLMKEDNE